MLKGVKFNSTDGDKLFLTYIDTGSRITQLSGWGFQFSAGNTAQNDQGVFSWQTGGINTFVERMRLINNGNLGNSISTPGSKLSVNGQIDVMGNKIINLLNPADNTDAVNKIYVDGITMTKSLDTDGELNLNIYTLFPIKIGIIFSYNNQSTLWITNSQQNALIGKTILVRILDTVNPSYIKNITFDTGLSVQMSLSTRSTVEFTAFPDGGGNIIWQITR